MMKEYHRMHPTISFRCRSIDEYKMIKEMVKYSGKSESTFIREILLDSMVKESQSFNSGYNQGLNKFEVPCSICGNYMVFDIKKDPLTFQKIIEIFGKYVHGECLETQKRQREAELQEMFNR